MIHKLSLICLLLLMLTSKAGANLSKEQIYSLFNQANQQFRQGNSTKDQKQAKRHYEKAILLFERIINEGQIKNAKLYYNLANAYFLQGQLGKAILNYRRAESLDDDKNVQKNVLKKYSDSLKDLSKLETDIENLNKQINKEIGLELYY